MKRLVFLVSAAGLLGCALLCSAQKSPEPGAAAGAPASSETASAPTTKPSRKRASPVGTPESPGSSLGGNYSTAGSRGDLIPPVMIRFSEMDAKASAALEEDLFVMARVISRTLERAHADVVDYKLNVPMLLTGSGRSVRPLYIEGLGPLFMIKVNFPLLPAPKGNDQANKPAPGDSEWTTAHREVFGTTEVAWPDESPARNSIYNEEKVELLKKELIGGLRNASNIRGLAPGEFVNIAVFGHASLRGKGSYAGRGGGYGDTIPAESGVDKGSVLTLRARKSDIDALAAGKLDGDAFRTKVLMTAYFGSGNGITSINSWIQESAGHLQMR
jgi:hypothetical protein